MNNEKAAYLSLVKNTFLDWQKSGCCADAIAMNEQIGTEYFGLTNPHFFTGDFEAELVLIHLNPKQSKDKQTNTYPTYHSADLGFHSFEDYLNYYTSFGKNKYGKEGKRNHKSPFDHKQIRFLRPFGLIPLDSSDNYVNLENVIDQKLQLELIPFGSESFNFRKVGSKNLELLIKPMLKLIASSDRKYTLFCGRVFEHVLNDFIVEKNKIEFKLTKKDGSETKNKFEIINLKIQIEDTTITGSIAPQFAKQGYPVEAYGKKIKELYGVF